MKTPNSGKDAERKRLHAPNGEGVGSIPGRGTKIPHAAWCGLKKLKIKIKKKKESK